MGSPLRITTKELEEAKKRNIGEHINYSGSLRRYLNKRRNRKVADFSLTKGRFQKLRFLFHPYSMYAQNGLENVKD